MVSISKKLLACRKGSGLTVKDLATKSGIDAALISKFENGKRMPTLENLNNIGQILSIPYDDLKNVWLAEKIYRLLEHEEDAGEILALAESRVQYLTSGKALNVPNLSLAVKEKLATIDMLHQRWTSKKPLIGTQLDKIKEYFNVAYTYESNRIEGNTLSLQETHLVVNEGLTIGGKSMREHLEAVNHSEAAHFIEDLVQKKEELTLRVLMEIHYLVLKGIDRINAGKYRSVPVRISGSSHMPPQPYLVDKLMEDYLIHYDQQKGHLHPVILAAEMHERLASIHPFIDGNGRTSRLVMNLILLQNGYTIANLKGDNASRIAYYKALENVQAHNDPEPFYHLVADAAMESLEQHLEMV